MNGGENLPVSNFQRFPRPKDLIPGRRFGTKNCFADPWPQSATCRMFKPSKNCTKRSQAKRSLRDHSLPPGFVDAARLHQAGQLDLAVARYQQVIRTNPHFADAHNNLGVALVLLRRIDEAKACFERAIRLRPDYADAHNNLANLFAGAGRPDDALPHFQRACALNPNLVNAHKGLAASFAARGQTDDAIRYYRIALAGNPDDPEVHNALANIFTFLGRLDEAAVHYAEAIRIRPSWAEAHFNRAAIKTFHPADPDLAALQDLVSRNQLSQADAVFAHFGLAKALEDCGDFDRAFGHMREGNALKRRQIDYDEPRVAAFFERIATVFDKGLINRFAGEGDLSPAPVFVVGMPRSGSTLVEQILSSHPQIHGAGELTELNTAVQTVLTANGGPGEYPECVPGLDGVTLRRIARTYLDRLSAQAGAARRIVDKLPGNLMYLGLIRMILPNAKIIHSVRDPVDTCLSCYSRLFTFGQVFTYDLGEIGRFFCRYTKLMAHWRSVLPADSILEVRYEDLVDDLEGQARRLIEFCGMPWDDRCLTFQKNSRLVRTASAVQVRSPIFRTSIHRWRRFESGLAPLLHELRELLPADA